MAPPSTPDKYPPSTAFDEITEIKVGSLKRKSFFMHKGVLCYYSGYFAGAPTNESRVESKDRVFDLNMEEIKDFESFQYWSHARKFSALEETIEEKYQGWRAISNLWVFGDRRNIPLLQNEPEVIDLLRRKIVATWAVPCQEAMHCKAINDKFLTDRFTKDALVNLVCVIGKWNNIPWSKEDLAALDMCQYHVHEDDVKCIVAAEAQSKT